MRTTLLLLSSAIASAIFGQCSFTPTITPEDLILCPNSDGVLSTQTYDSYQWYREGALIDGATAQTFPVTSGDDGGYHFSVSVTLDGCTEVSAEVLVDGWVFGFPNLIHEGDEPYGTGNEGQSYFCAGDTLIFEITQPITTNIVWTNNGEPIAGETGTMLTVTSDGNYSASGAPEVCPEFVMWVGVEVPVEFTPVSQPVIEQDGGQLCASPEGNSYQWYVGGEPLADSNMPCIDGLPNAPVTVFVDYGAPCQMISEAYVSTGIDASTSATFQVQPVPANDVVRITWSSGSALTGNWHLVDMTGRSVNSGRFNGNNALEMDVRDLPSGKYAFTATGMKPIALSVAH